MKQDVAMLLPALHKEFHNQLFNNAGYFPQVKEIDVPNNCWLLSQLYEYYGDMLQVQCRNNRHGTLLHHKSCDLSYALSTALANSSFEKNPHEIATANIPTAMHMENTDQEILNFLPQ